VILLCIVDNNGILSIHSAQHLRETS